VVQIRLRFAIVPSRNAAFDRTRACAPSAINLFLGRLISLDASESTGRRGLRLVYNETELCQTIIASNREKCKCTFDHACAIDPVFTEISRSVLRVCTLSFVYS